MLWEASSEIALGEGVASTASLAVGLEAQEDKKSSVLNASEKLDFILLF